MPTFFWLVFVYFFLVLLLLTIYLCLKWISYILYLSLHVFLISHISTWLFINITLNLKIEVTYCIVHPFEYTSQWCSISELCNRHSNQLWTFLFSQNPMLISSQSLFLPVPPTLCFLSLDLLILDTSHKQNHTMYSLYDY